VVVGLVSFCFKGKHLLIMLLSLEYVSIGVFLFIVSLIGVTRIYFPVVFLIFVVCEGVIGLSVLISIRRSHGIGGLIRIQWGYI
jgi:NADH-ubiquinone oxidoreductase chain 4L